LRIENESAMWIRVILARALFRMGRAEFARGILWGLRNEDAYLRKLAAALARDLKIQGVIEPLQKLLADSPETAGYAARALLSDNSPAAVKALLEGLDSGTLRKRRAPPLNVFWEGRPSALHPFTKDFDNDWLWVLFADDRQGRRLDLYLTWATDGKTWNEPVFTGLTSFADPEGQTPLPTFSLKVRSREVTIGLTRSFAQNDDPAKPSFGTVQRVHEFKFQDFFKDKDNDGLKDPEEAACFTNPQNPDSDGDGLNDGQDKNPLAKPASPERDEETIKLLAFSYAFLVKEALPGGARLLTVVQTPGGPRAPELPSYPWLVLHLRPEQVRGLWQATGAGYPRVSFGATRLNGARAVQPLIVSKAADDRVEIEVSFTQQNGQWVVSGYHEEL